MKNQKASYPFVTIMIAALNEEKNITKVIKECLKLNKLKTEILVILDSKTTDNTKGVAEKAGARVIQTGKWKGKGAALRLAQKYIKGDYVVQIDADYQFMPRDIPKFINALQEKYDVALGSRYEKGAKVENGSVTQLRQLGIHFLSLATSLACRQRITDMPAGFKAFKTSVLKNIHISVDHYGYEAEEIIKAARKGYKITNIPIEYKKRIQGNSKLAPIKDGFMFLGTIIKTSLEPLT
jgi:glycosyltransferase involved in cell wall biosynthesis